MGIKSSSKIVTEIQLSLTEGEAHALQALACYGHKVFLKFFYEHLGTHYLKPHEKDLISLFDTIKSELPQHLDKVKECREMIASKK